VIYVSISGFGHGEAEDFARRMRAEAQKWSKLIQAIGLALE
jgi:hypothetical protein